MTAVEKHETSPAPGDWLSRWFEDWPSSRWLPEMWRGRLLEGFDPMRVEEFQDDDTLVVKVEMPGLDPDKDVDIDVTEQTLRIRAERREESKVEAKKGQYHSEFRYGSFSRTVPLPPGATDQDVEATYKDGILEVRIPIDHRKAEARKIPVQRA